MKNVEKCMKYLYCFNSLSLAKIEIIKISSSIFGTILAIINLSVIHWKYTSNVMKVFQILSLIFFLLILFISSFILFFQKKNKINKYITKFILLCFFEFFLCIFSIFINLFITIGAIPDLRKNNKIKENDNGLLNNSDNDNNFLVSNGELSYAIISMIFNIFIWIILLLLSISDLIRIKLGISGSYIDYIKGKNEEGNSKKEFNIFNTSEKIEFPNVNKEVKSAKKKEKENGMNLSLEIKNNNLNNSLNLYDAEQKNILKYSYKEKLRNKNCNSVDDMHKSKKIKEKIDKEKYFEKYMEGYGINPNYSNFGNKSIINISTMNNSINPDINFG